MLPPVNKSKCATCPFRDTDDPSCLEVRNSVIERITVGAKSQLCHHTGKTLCRGARDFQLILFHRMGFIPEPTDKAWNTQCQAMGIPIATNSGKKKRG